MKVIKSQYNKSPLSKILFLDIPAGKGHPYCTKCEPAQ